MASFAAVGTPLVQLEAIDQLVLVVPFQLVWENEKRAEKITGMINKIILVKIFIVYNGMIGMVNFN